MSSYQAVFFSKLQGNIRDLEGKLTADEQKNITHDIVNTCYWAQALLETFRDMGDVRAMIAMTASCDFTLMNARDAALKESHDKNMAEAIQDVALRVTAANQGK